MKIKFSYTLEDPLGAFSVSFFVRGGDEKVFHVDNKPSFSYHVAEGVIHEVLEGGRRVGKTKEHEVGLKRPLWVMKVAFH